jgi:Flp pilus assembly protein TadG
MNRTTPNQLERGGGPRIPGFVIRLFRSRLIGAGASGAGGRRGFFNDEGATIVEMAIVSAVLLQVLFGIIMISFAYYTYNFVSDAAREGSRYAIVRGAFCVNFTDCNAGQAEISTYVKSLSYPGIDPANLTVTAEWYTATIGSASTETSITDCGSNPTAIGIDNEPCNYPRNHVQVYVKYNFPLGIPFFGSATLPLQSISQMVISE